MSAKSKFTVAICGGGVGGLTCALALSKYRDINVDIYEAAAQFSEVGAGIEIWQRVWKVLQHLGLEDDLEVVRAFRGGDRVLPIRFRKSDQAEGFDFYELATSEKLFTFHRADFHQVLLRHLPESCRTHFKRRLRSYSQNHSNPIELQFTDGTAATCDILVGADGIKSSVRGSLLKEKGEQALRQGSPLNASHYLSCIEPVWTGTVAYRALIPASRLKARSGDCFSFPNPIQPTQYMGKNAHVIVYPISQGRLINLVAFHAKYDLAGSQFEGPWVVQVDKQELRAQFANWEPELRILLENVEIATRWAIHTVKPLRSFVHERVALIGDAAHAMSPHQGSGAGQAIEDAYLLASLLGHTHARLENITPVLRIYDEARHPFSTNVAERSLQNGRYFTLNFNGFDFDNCNESERKEKLLELGKAVSKNWEWTWSSTLDDAVKTATRKIESL